MKKSTDVKINTSTPIKDYTYMDESREEEYEPKDLFSTIDGDKKKGEKREKNAKR